MSEIQDIINNSLKISSNLIYDKAHELCKNGIMDVECCWYHSIWQYLRLLNVVSSPTWHDEFYSKELNESFKDKERINILISGTADYSILIYITEIIKKLNIKDINIYVLDSCKTPLYCCQWYADRNNIIIHTINEDILKYNNYNFFDVICTDAFLTRFSKTEASKVIINWEKLLKTNGKIITTIRIHEDNELYVSEYKQEIKDFVTKVKLSTQKNQEFIKFSPDKMAAMAEIYAIKMKSNDLGDENAILSLFNEFKTRYRIKTVTGELKETKYLELVAEKL